MISELFSGEIIATFISTTSFAKLYLIYWTNSFNINICLSGVSTSIVLMKCLILLRIIFINSDDIEPVDIESLSEL